MSWPSPVWVERPPQSCLQLDLVENPGASKRPVGFCRGKRNAESFGCFLVCHADEVSQLDYLGFDGMFFGELVQDFMDGEYLLVRTRGGEILPLQIHSFEAAAVALS